MDLFYLPNMTWPSPLGYTIQMISASTPPNGGLLVHFADDLSWNDTLDVVAVRDTNATTVVVRVVNTVNNDLELTVTSATTFDVVDVTSGAS